MQEPMLRADTDRGRDAPSPHDSLDSVEEQTPPNYPQATGAGKLSPLSVCAGGGRQGGRVAEGRRQ